MNSIKFPKKTPIAAAILMLTASPAFATQSATYNAISSVNNNFTMLGADNSITGGTNDVLFTWTGTTFDASSDYTGPASTANVTASSSAPFFGHAWTAHDIQVFAPGTYTFDPTLGGGAAETGTLTMTVGANQLGAHMLFDWNGNNNIDVAVVWNKDSTFPAPSFTGGYDSDDNTTSTVFMLSSMDADGDGIKGIPMPAGGPFQYFNANFSFKGPNGFLLTDKTNVVLSTATESAPITINGFCNLAGACTGTAGITISGAATSQYAISTNGGTTYGSWTSAAGTVSEGYLVKVRHTSSASNSTVTNTTLKIGLHSDTFTSTTEALVCDTGDTTPDSFNFTSQANVSPGATVESDAVTVAGICTGVNVAISISGGDSQYAISTDGGTTYGSYTSSAGTVTKDDKVKVRHTAASTGSTSTVTTLTMGGVAGTFTSTTTVVTNTTYSMTVGEPSGAKSCSISPTPVNAMERADWWLVAGFLAWLGALRMRFKRQA